MAFFGIDEVATGATNKGKYEIPIFSKVISTKPSPKMMFLSKKNFKSPKGSVVLIVDSKM